MLLLDEPNKVVREIRDISWGKSFDGAVKNQQLGLWFINRTKAAGWYVVLVAVRERKKGGKWGRVEWILSRWQKVGGLYHRHAWFRMSPDVMADVCAILPGAREEISELLEQVGTSTKIPLPEVLPGEATLPPG